MISKGTAEYREAQKNANIIQDFSMEVVTPKNPQSKQKFTELHLVLTEVKKLGVFASQVAETLLSQMDKTTRMPRVSSKQSWIIACAMVENEVYIDEI